MAYDLFNKSPKPRLLQSIIRKELLEGTCAIEVRSQDPNPPLYSITTFEALHLNPNLLKGVYEMGFNVPTSIQQLALPSLLADPPQNLIAQSQYGTGKTLAMVLAMLNHVDPDKNYPQVVCLSPTLELAIQTGELAAHLAKNCPEIELKYAVRGEMSSGITMEHVIIGTPRKVLDWGVNYGAFDLSKITLFALDEADAIIATLGHRTPCLEIFKCLNRKCQMMLFSTTYDKEVIEYAEMMVPNPLIIKLSEEAANMDNIQQCYVKCTYRNDKYRAVINVCKILDGEQAIIFCNTKLTANWISENLTKDGYPAAVLCSELPIQHRLDILDRFRSGQEKVLLATNVLSRGIHITQVMIVVNFDLPMDACNEKLDCDTYLHRIGRIGRFGKKGIAINLIKSLEDVYTIENHFNRKVRPLNDHDFDELL